jgi:hypothetical protein
VWAAIDVGMSSTVEAIDQDEQIGSGLEDGSYISGTNSPAPMNTQINDLRDGFRREIENPIDLIIDHLQSCFLISVRTKPRRESASTPEAPNICCGL